MNKYSILMVLTLAVITLFSVHSAYAAKSTDTTRPGWGLGDPNHVHLGPPGQSVRPIDVTQSNDTQVTNNETFSVNTGANNADHTTGGSTHVTTGSANIFVQVWNFIGHNIFKFS